MAPNGIKTPLHPILPQFLERMDPVFTEYYNKHHADEPQTHEIPLATLRDPGGGLIIPGRSKGPEVGNVTNLIVPVEGGTINVRMYEPRESGSGALRPAYINMHGGGWTVGEGGLIDEPFCRLAVHETDCVAFDVDYRVSPEYKYPIPLDDCWAAIRHIYSHAQDLGVDKKRIAAGGCSAGGHLAAVTSIMARDAGIPFVAQILGCPCCDATATDESGEIKIADDCRWESWHSNAEAPCLPLTTMAWYYNNFLGLPRPKDYKNDWKLSSIKAPNLKGLPPALIVTAEFDVLRDEGEALGRRLEEAGVEVQVVRMKGVPHPFPLFDAVLDAGKQYNKLAIAWLRKGFSC